MTTGCRGDKDLVQANVMFVLAFCALVWLHRNGERLRHPDRLGLAQ